MRDAKADLAICEAATPGPWEYEWQYTYSKCPWTVQTKKEHPVKEWICSLPQRGFQTVGDANSEFIVTAREALPYWIRRAMELQEVLQLVVDTYQSKNLWKNWGVDNQGDVAGKAEDGHSLSAMGMAIYKAMSVLDLK